MRHIRTFVAHLSPNPEQRIMMVSMRVTEIHGFVNALRTCSRSTENHEQTNHVMAKLFCAIFHEFRAFLVLRSKFRLCISPMFEETSIQSFYNIYHSSPSE